MSIEDYMIRLIDLLDYLAGCTNVNQQQYLRHDIGGIIAVLREQLDNLDYNYALFVCEIEPDIADQYRQLYLNEVKARVEVVA